MGRAAQHATRAFPPSDIERLARLREIAQHPGVENAVAAVRELTDMEVAFSSRISESDQVIEAVSGDGGRFGIEPGSAIPIEDTFCQRVLAGRLPQVVADVAADERAANVPVATEHGVGAYVSVPIRFSDGHLYGTLCAASRGPTEHVAYRELQFVHVFARIVSDELEREQMREQVRELELRAASARTLISAVEMRDSYTGEHSRAVVDQAVAVARRLGLDDEASAEVGEVAMLHDIGKIAVPDQILRKPGPLDDEEWNIMRCHSAKGAELVLSTPGLEHLAPAIRAEHERWDGSGYPDGLERRGDPAREPHHPRLRRLQRDDERPAVPGCAQPRGRPGRDRCGPRGAVLPDSRVLPSWR